MRSSVLILFLAPTTVLSRSAFNIARHNHQLARRGAPQDLNLDAGAIFPLVELEKRGLLDLVTTLVGGVVSPLTAALLPPATTTTTTPAATTMPATVPTSSNAQGGSGDTPANPTNNDNPAGTSPTTTAGAGNNNNNANPSANGNSSASSAGAANIPKDGNGVTGASGTGSVIPRLVTDHAGNTMTITAPVTMTYVTTLPNGVVSTVTETFTPNPITTTENSQENGLGPSKIAAIVGTIVTVFLITFTVAFVCLMIRKRQKRAIALSTSRPTSYASSFGSVSDEYAHDERRNSRTGLTQSASHTSFRTAPAYVDGAKLDFPLPPVPASPSRPVSGHSDVSFNFSQNEKSRASIIEERNQLRKIGQYPDADSYTPFALPPSSEFSHTEESVSPVIANKKSFRESYRSGQEYLTVHDNPFSDPATPTQASYAPITNPLANNSARRTMLWSTPYGAVNPNAPTPQEASPSRDTLMSLTSDEYGTAQSHSYGHENAFTDESVSRRPSGSTGRFSYHSAFETYAQGNERSRSPNANQNPFADQPLEAPKPAVVYPSLRPDTANSSAGTSVMSGGSGPRKLGGTPDPRDLFYSSPTPDRGRARMSVESKASSDGGATVRGSRVVYPALITRANQ